MEKPKSIAIIVLFITSLSMPTNGQSSNTMCTGAMIRSFNPCISFLTGTGSGGSSSPTSGCCSSLKDLMSNGQNCLCLLVTGGIPLQIPFNRSLAMSLPRACKMSGVPVECKATPSPVPAPDPRSGGNDQPTLSPGLSPPTPTGGLLPLPLTPPQTPSGGNTIPTLTPPGMRPTLDPSTATTHLLSHQFVSLSIVLSTLGVVFIMI